MATKTTAAQTAQATEIKNEVVNIFSNYDTTKGHIGDTLSNEISAHTLANTVDALCTARITAYFVRRVNALIKKGEKEKQAINIAASIAADHIKRIDSIIQDYKDEKAAEEKAVEKIARFVGEKKTYYTAFNVAVNVSGGIVIANITDKMFRVFPCDDIKLFNKLVAKASAPQRERTIKEGEDRVRISETKYNEKPVFVAVVTNTPAPDGSKYRSSYGVYKVEYTGELKPIKDAFHGRSVSVWNGISKAVKSAINA